MKKITVMIPDETFSILDRYCRSIFYNKKSYKYKDIINLAILNYCRKNTV